MIFYFTISTFSENSFWNTIKVENSLDPDQARDLIGPDLGPNRFQSTLVGKELT